MLISCTTFNRYAVRCGGSLQPQVRKYAATAGASMEASQGVTGDLVNEDWCVRISTGGVVPDGADAVVQVEDTELLEVNVRVFLHKIKPNDLY